MSREDTQNLKHSETILRKNTPMCFFLPFRRNTPSVSVLHLSCQVDYAHQVKIRSLDKGMLERRCTILQLFLNRLALHPKMGRLHIFHLFISTAIPLPELVARNNATFMDPSSSSIEENTPHIFPWDKAELANDAIHVSLASFYKMCKSLSKSLEGNRPIFQYKSLPNPAPAWHLSSLKPIGPLPLRRTLEAFANFNHQATRRPIRLWKRYLAPV